jgi:L-ornithine N5-monooxygenase
MDADIICVGFGATALALAVALHERDPDANIVFLERQPKATWKPLARLPGHTSMQTSFMSDLVTFENPRSRFTFLKFLHDRNLLVNFTNVGKTKPCRELFSQYLSWCADHFEQSVRYSTEVAGIDAVTTGSDQADHWRVFSRSSVTGQKSILRAKRVVIAVGQQPKIPTILTVPTVAPSVVHVSECEERLEALLGNTNKISRIAIIGDGQQAAEIFDYTHSRRTQHEVTMFLRSDSVDSVSDCTQTPISPTQGSLPPELRAKPSHAAAAEPQSITDDLLYRLNESQYTQSVKEPNPSRWQYKILSSQRLSCAASTADGRVCLALTDTRTDTTTTCPTSFDLVIAATGYDNSLHKRLLAVVAEQKLLESPSGVITVDGHYRVNLRRKMVRNGRGLWLTGHLGDQSEEIMMPLLAERGRRLVDSLMAVKALENLEHEDQDEQAEIHARL